MRYLVAGLLGMTQAPALALVLPALAEEKAVANPAAAPKPAPQGKLPVAADPLATGTDEAAADKIVPLVRTKLADPSLRKGAAADDLAALEAFYAARTSGPLWMTEMGFTARAQEALFEIETADDWGLDPAAFELPSAGALPKTPDAQAMGELKLSLAILKYARFARGGRLDPPEVSKLFDQAPPSHDPNAVLAAIETAASSAAYLQSLHPKHEQFARLRQALLEARGTDEASDKEEANDKNAASGKTKASGKPLDGARDIKRLVLNMERWRWMPEDLGSLYIWSNSPEFMLYVVKDGKTIYSDKTLIGTINYATPVFTADMETIVFNPDWIAPSTVLVEEVLPSLRNKHYTVLKTHMLRVSYKGKPVDVTKVKWSRKNILNYTFTQKAGPKNVLGKAKFLYPNKHVVYMHDTLPVRKKVFKKPVRALGHECVRMERPDKFAEILLAESNGTPEAEVKKLWDESVNGTVTLTRKIPVHTTYFTAVVDETGKVSTFNDLYGLDRKLAAALFGDAKGFPQPPAEPKKRGAPSAGQARTASGNSITRTLQGFLGD